MERRAWTASWQRLLPVALAVLTLAPLLAVALPVGTASTPAVAGAPEVEQCVARPELGPDSSGDDVRCLQYLLILLGLPVGYTGVYDQRTADAVRWYQATHPPLSADGIAGEQTLISLGIRGEGKAPAAGSPETLDGTATPIGVPCLADAEQKVGSQGQSVECIQRRMTELGLYAGAANGTYDAKLEAAIRGFQQAHPPLQVDGRSGPRTLAALGIWSGVSPANGVANGTIGSAPVASTLELEPNWNMTPDGIPYYGNRKACSRDDAITIATEFAKDGADIATQYWAVYIASREGGCRADAVNVNPATRDDSHCSFQINVLSGTFEPHGELGRRGWTPELIKMSIRNCADAASDLWVFCGRGPWTPPYSCRPPWEGARDTPMDPLDPSTVTTAPTPDTTPATEPPAATAPDTAPPPAETAPVTSPPMTTPATSPPATDPPDTAPPATGTTIPTPP